MDLISQSDGASFIDVGYGAPVHSSSSLAGWPEPDRLVPGRRLETSFFHTESEDNPNLTIDLEDVRPIRRMRIFNDEGLPARATPLVIQGSIDKLSWTDLASVNYIFGGRISRCPVDLMFRESACYRFIKLTVLRQTFFHLHYVEILARAPETELGRLVNLRLSKPLVLAEYLHHDSHGFSWTFTYTLGVVINARAEGIEVDRIDFSRCLTAFKDARDDDPYQQLFAPLGQRDRLIDVEHASFAHHGVYATLNLGTLKQYVDVYFTPSQQVLDFQNYIVRKYELDLPATIAIVYRGTDKITEVEPAPIERYIDVAQGILRARPDLKLVIQTDQRQALNAVRAAIPTAVHFEEMPVTTGAAPVHELKLEQEFALAKSQFALRMLATTHLLAKAKYLVSHTGNIGLWLALYRGNSAGFHQFDPNTDLRDPKGEVIPTVDVANL